MIRTFVSFVCALVAAASFQLMTPTIDLHRADGSAMRCSALSEDWYTVPSGPSVVSNRMLAWTSLRRAQHTCEGARRSSFVGLALTAAVMVAALGSYLLAESPMRSPFLALGAVTAIVGAYLAYIDGPRLGMGCLVVAGLMAVRRPRGLSKRIPRLSFADAH